MTFICTIWHTLWRYCYWDWGMGLPIHHLHHYQTPSGSVCLELHVPQVRMHIARKDRNLTCIKFTALLLCPLRVHPLCTLKTALLWPRVTGFGCLVYQWDAVIVRRCVPPSSSNGCLCCTWSQDYPVVVHSTRHVWTWPVLSKEWLTKHIMCLWFQQDPP